MKILVLTPIYETFTGKTASPPIVHYFAREWVKQGHQVKAFCIEPKYPSFFYLFARLFQKQLNNKLGFVVPIKAPLEEIYNAEGIEVHRLTVRKIKPHARYCSKRVVNTISSTLDIFNPDIIIAHWANPCLDIICRLKNDYNIPASLVFHSSAEDMRQLYGKDLAQYIKQLNYVGFRSKSMKEDFEKMLGQIPNSFISYSGVAKQFLDNYKARHSFGRIRNFIFSGSLIGRKYPDVVYKSIVDVLPEGDFKITYIGDGEQKNVILSQWERYGKIGTLNFTGRISREEIPKFLRESEVFVMISKNEIFGLVYLEAMAMGCITIGSRNEGIDGIIIDGENGFLCEAGNQEELSSIIKKIQKMDESEILRISCNARKTAEQFSDSNVAKLYLNNFTCN